MVVALGRRTYDRLVAGWKKAFGACLKLKLDIALSQAPSSGSVGGGDYTSNAEQSLTLSLDWDTHSLMLDPAEQSKPTVITTYTHYDPTPGCDVLGIARGESIVTAEASMDTKLVKDQVKLTSLIAAPSYDYPGSAAGDYTSGADTVTVLCLQSYVYKYPLFSVTQQLLLAPAISTVEQTCFKSQLATPVPRKSFKCDHVPLGSPDDQAVYGSFELSRQ
jgi:hypothetical protein